MTLAGGGQIEGRGLSCCEECQNGEHDEQNLDPDRARMFLVDLCHTFHCDGFKADIFEDCHGRYTDTLLGARMYCSPYGHALEEQEPLVDIELGEGRHVENLTPDGMATFIANLREQADRLDNVRVQLVAARAEWNGEAPALAPRPADACPVEWCDRTGIHQGHCAEVPGIPVPGPLGHAYLGAELLDADDNGHVIAGFEGGGDWRDLDAAGLRAEIAKIRAHLPKLTALADQLAAIEADHHSADLGGAA
ncbi:hypothetical protein GCM10027091_15610 [Streptomyces daliensis]